MEARYDAIGLGYAARRRPDPRIARRILTALGDARTVVNVGAGTGSYEPVDRAVAAVEPSKVMAAQRPATLPPAVRATAEALPFADDAADAVMGVLTIHHWRDPEAGVREALRVARRRVVLVTIDAAVEARMWLLADYVPQIAARDAAEFPAIAMLTAWLGAGARSEVIPIPADCEDHFGLAFWNAPERVLDPRARAATSGFARLDDAVEQAAVARLAADLESGAWDRRHGELRTLAQFDAGLRLVTVEL